MARQERSEGRDDRMRGGTGSAQERTVGDGQQMDAIDMLKADHRKVEQLFERFQTAKRRAEKLKIAQEICRELTVHAELEEEIFYPACREHIDDPMLDEAQVEHDSAKVLVYDIAIGTPTSDPFFDAKVKVLSEHIRHHIDEEERSPDSIFAKAIEAEVDTAALGEQMQARRAELMEENARSLFLPEPTTLHVAMEDREGGAHESQGRGGREEERRGGEQHRGWHGDPKRHAEASRRGWEHRR